MDFRLSIIIIFIFICVPVYSLTLKYRQNTISNDLYHVLVMSSIENGYHLTGISDLTGNNDFILNPDFSTLKWKYSNPGKKIDLESVRVGNTIKIKGIFKGEPIDKTISINSDPWIEQWEIGLESYIMSDTKEKTFWSVNPNNLNQIAEFKAVKKKEETIDLGGSKVESVKVKVALTGLIGSFFHFDFYFRKSDGRLLLENYPEVKKGVPNRVVLIDEED